MNDDKNKIKFSNIKSIYINLQDNDGIDGYELIDNYVLTVEDITKILTNYYWKFEHFILPNQLERIVERNIGPSFKNWQYNKRYLPIHSKKVKLPFPDHNITFHGDDLVDDHCYTLDHLNK